MSPPIYPLHLTSCLVLHYNRLTKVLLLKYLRYKAPLLAVPFLRCESGGTALCLRVEPVENPAKRGFLVYWGLSRLKDDRAEGCLLHRIAELPECSRYLVAPRGFGDMVDLN